MDRKRLEMLAELTLHAFPALFIRRAWMASDTPMARIHEAHRRNVRRKLAAMSVVRRVLVIGIWPPLMAAMAIYMTARTGRAIARRDRRTVPAQFADQIRLAFVEGVPPLFYYSDELQRAENRGRAHEFLRHWHLKFDALYNRLYEPRFAESRHLSHVLNDKLAFYRFCRENGLPCATVHAGVDDGRFAWAPHCAERLPRETLIVKPRRGKGGRGVERWVWRDGRYGSGDGTTLSPDGLAEHVAGLSRIQRVIVQSCLANHPELGELTAGALSTLRMYTFRDEAGEVEHVFSMYRMSRAPHRVIDNIHGGAIASAVDPRTGTLGRATDAGIHDRTGWLDEHPVTGARITGRRLPLWPETLALALSAHRHLEDAYLVGWDVAITESGPVLVEGNKAPAVDIEQRLDAPWGNARFGQLLVHHLEAAGAA